MEDVLKSKCVHSERPLIRQHRFDLAIYQIRDAFYAAWYCSECLERNETPRYVNQVLAYQEALDAMADHLEAVHGSNSRRGG